VAEADKEFRGEEIKGDAMFQKTVCFRACCMGFRWGIYLIGAILAVINQAFDIVYTFQSPYQSSVVFQITCAIIIVRVVISQGIAQYYYTVHVRNYKPSLGKFHDINDVDKEETLMIQRHGVNLYSGLHLLYLTGAYRVLDIKDFRSEKQLGYLSELVVSTLPMLFCQIFNNYETKKENFTSIQGITIGFKVLMIIYLFLELTIFVWEAVVYRKKQKNGVAGFEKPTEEERR
jgi:hypothetical protein